MIKAEGFLSGRDLLLVLLGTTTTTTGGATTGAGAGVGAGAGAAVLQWNRFASLRHGARMR